MIDQAAAFGIDFGTTNTRVALYRAGKLRMVPFLNEQGQRVFQLPTLVSYQDGEPTAFGHAARARGDSQSIKWLLGETNPVQVGPRLVDPVDMAAAFFGYLRTEVGRTFQATPLERAAVTIPVHFPTRARQNLFLACQKAGIEVTQFYFEPVAAIYCDLISHPTSGVSAVFDWGGGSLDLATVHIHDGIAFTRAVDGWRRGGSDMDELVRHNVLYDFFQKNSGLGLNPELVKLHKPGRDLLTLAEGAKIELSRSPRTAIERIAFLAGKNLNFPLTRETFERWIEMDVTAGIQRMEHALSESKITWEGLSRLVLSGGTCNVPCVKMRLEERAGSRLVNRLTVPAALQLPSAAGGLDDIGNATAVGAALLAVHSARPVLGNDIGVRLAGAGDDCFETVFHRGETIDGQPRNRQYFLTDASSGVARLLVCERSDPVLQPQGRLLRLLSVPIDRSENILTVEFIIGSDLVLTIAPKGNIKVPRVLEPAAIQQLNLGFHLPTLESEPAVV